MFRPSAIIVRMAGTPSAVPGIFTSRFGLSMRSWRLARRLDRVPCVSCASAGATSSDTNPSAPSDDSWTPASIARASVMSVITSSQ